jgi:hypothetical protein
MGSHCDGIKCFFNPPEIRRVAYLGTDNHDIPVMVAGVHVNLDGIERWELLWDNVPPP